MVEVCSCRFFGDEISNLVTQEGPGEFLSEDSAEGAWFIFTTVRLKSSDSGIECLEEEGFAQGIGGYDYVDGSDIVPGKVLNWSEIVKVD